MADKDNKSIEFRCLQVVQPIGTFYVGVMDYADVIHISYADVRRIEQREVEVVLGIQRPLSEKRVEELRKYVKTVDATFPTSIILAIDQFPQENADGEKDGERTANIVFDEAAGVMKIRRDINVAKIIDGQHRIAGLMNYDGPPFQLNVTLFVDMDLEDQALVFATINLTQTKVSKSLVYDLYEYAVARSPQKSCHNIAKLLNSHEISPLRNRIKILGRATGKRYEFITQATFVERLIGYISRDPMKDRDAMKRHRSVPRATPTQERSEKLMFRNMFLDNRDEDIALVVWNYFSAVSAKWPAAWSTDEQGFILNRTTGFAALMRFLAYAYLNVSTPGSVPKKSDFAKIFETVELGDNDFVSTTFLPGTTGEKELLNTLLSKSRLDRSIPK